MKPSPASPTRNLRVAVLLVLSVLLSGTLGYTTIERLSLLDALFTTVSMMSTVGLLARPLSQTGLSQAGEIFTIVIMVLGIGSLLYTFGVIMEYVIEGHLSLAVRRRRMENKIAGLRDHYIICGFGRVGMQIAHELAAAGKRFVVVDEKDSSIENCLAHGYLAIGGDATIDEVLRKAGIANAISLLAATDNDSTNISITLSARHLSQSLSRSLYIIARANHNETEVKLKLAGANQVLSPYTSAGHRMANLALQPNAAKPQS